MNPGRDLDALVAERVMGFLPPGPGMWWTHPDNPLARYGGPREYSTDIAAAWQVVERLHGVGDLLSLDYGKFHLDLWDDLHWQARFRDSEVHACARTAPHAICLAALRAVGVEV